MADMILVKMAALGIVMGKGIWDCVFMLRVDVDATVGSDVERGIRVWDGRRECDWVVVVESAAWVSSKDAHGADGAVVDEYDNV